MSFFRNVYYDLKPYLPVSARMTLRRKLARRRLAGAEGIWPINPDAGRKPDGWPGWPDGKQFALVLTHDVESSTGLAKSRQLMELEMSFGFRSSFNFIPEGEYRVPVELRSELAANGFEVGVHDLRHDGKLYRSKKHFDAAVPIINQYLKDWNATGFRSGFMHNNLDWLHALDLQYDMSTFDTDPFEPQPEGVNTIFPFFVKNCQAGKGYVEMPYTLPQDSTLFLILGESNIDIWKRKLDWIAKCGGMALLNVHPDYMAFNGTRSENAYSVRLYERFLKHIQTTYPDRFWQALPSEVSSYCCRVGAKAEFRRPKRIAMVAYSFYESDNRVMRYAESLAERGDSVDVFALAGQNSGPSTELINGVRVFHLQRRVKNERGKFSYLFRVVSFFLVSSTAVSWNHLKSPYSVVHVHNVPDFLVFTALFPKLMGARIILDIHDILPEFFASKFTASANGFYLRALKWVERISCRFADNVVISNHLWWDTITSRSVSPEKCSTFINYVDTKVFHPRSRTRNDGRRIVIFPGGLQRHQGLDIAIRAFTQVRVTVPNAELHIYGDGPMKNSLMALRDQLELSDSVRFFEPVSLRQIADIVANADVGIVPKRADSFGNEAYSTKIMEFMSQGIPVAASRTKIDMFYFDARTVLFFESGNQDDLARAIIAILTDGNLARGLIECGRDYIHRNNWTAKKQAYFAIVDGEAHCVTTVAQIGLFPGWGKLIFLLGLE